MCFVEKIEAMLHPVRYRIIQKFLAGETKTAKMLSKELTDIPQATLYRQLDALVKADILLIVEENHVRGTVEKVYKLNLKAVRLTNEDIKELTKEEHLQYFLLFTAQLARDFENYLNKDNIDFERDGAGYRQAALYLSDEEFIHFMQDLRKVFETYGNKPEAPHRKKRLIATISIPEEGKKNG